MKRTDGGLWVDAHEEPRATTTETIAGMPAWVHSIAYRGADEITTLRVLVPGSQLARPHVLALEADHATLRVLHEALGRCLSQSEAKTTTVIDVPTSP